MAKTSMIQRDVKRERLSDRYAKKRKVIKEALKSSTLGYSGKINLFKAQQNLPRNSAPSRQRNRCWVTGRSRSFYRDFGLSRHVLREMAHEGTIPGLTKSSW
jgi:small subunit ribosomal protein S14